jgi:hypothetical protein
MPLFGESWDVGLAVWALGLLDPLRLPALAMRALEDGLDSPSLRRLAGADATEVPHVSALFAAALAEIGIVPPAPAVAARQIGDDVAGRIIRGDVDPLDGARFLTLVAREASKGRPFHGLDPFVYADSEVDDRPADRQLFIDMIRAAAATLVERGRSPVNSSPDVSTIALILLKADPIGLYFRDVANTDEYAGEARHISESLEGCKNYDECLDLVWGVFRESFGVAIAQARERYASVARAIWDAHRGSGQASQAD